MPSERRRINIVEVNANSVRDKIDNIKILLEELKDSYNVLVINDTRLINDTEFYLQNYSIIAKHHDSGTRTPGGVAFMIHKDLTARTIEGLENTSESICIEIITPKKKKIRILTTYLHPGSKMKRVHMNTLTKNSRDTDLLVACGDFNAHVGLLDNEQIDRAGETILDLCAEFGFNIANENVPTYFASNRNTNSALDLTLVKNRTGLPYSWRTGTSIGSDHIPTILEINEHTIYPKRLRTNWTKFREKLAEVDYPEIIADKKSMDDGVTYLTNKIQETTEQCSRKVRTDRTNGQPLSADSNNLIKLRRKLLNARIDWTAKGIDGTCIRKMLNRCNLELKKSLKKDRDRHETLEAGKIMTETDSTKKWTLLRKFEESQTAHTGRSGIENEQGKVTMIESELAEIHATRLEQTHTHPTDIATMNGKTQSTKKLHCKNIH